MVSLMDETMEAGKKRKRKKEDFEMTYPFRSLFSDALPPYSF